LTNIVAQRFDARIRLGESLEKNVVAVPVTGQLRMAVVGSPQYFAVNPVPVTPHDLREHRCINFRLPSAGTLYKWEFEKAHHSIEVGVEGPLIFDDEGLVIDAALAGVGLAYMIEDQFASLLQAGAPSRVLDDWCPPFSRLLSLLLRAAPGISCTGGVYQRDPVAVQGQEEPLIDNMGRRQLAVAVSGQRYAG
jgi:DNA-binding transcriptional LysR family regulator